jgi:LacI family repressor for deo operon, udp, cdd, tsx, nupC, and nupG
VVPKLSPFFLEIFAGAEEAAQTAGLAVLLGNSDGKPEREEACFDQVMSGRADGIILLTGLVPSSYADGKRAIPPMVTVLERLQGHDAPVVRIDHRAASAEITRHLIELGPSCLCGCLRPEIESFPKVKLRRSRTGRRSSGSNAQPGLNQFGESSGACQCASHSSTS